MANHWDNIRRLRRIFLLERYGLFHWNLPNHEQAHGKFNPRKAFAHDQWLEPRNVQGGGRQTKNAERGRRELNRGVKGQPVQGNN